MNYRVPSSYSLHAAVPLTYCGFLSLGGISVSWTVQCRPQTLQSISVYYFFIVLFINHILIELIEWIVTESRRCWPTSELGNVVVFQELLHPGTVVGVHKSLLVRLHTCKRISRSTQIHSDGGISLPGSLGIDQLNCQGVVVRILGEPHCHWCGRSSLAGSAMENLGCLHMMSNC